MKIAIVAIALTALFGLGLTAMATPGNPTFMDMKPLSANSAKSATPTKKVASSGWSLFQQTPQEVAGAAGTPEQKKPEATKKTETAATTDQESADEDADEGDADELDPNTAWEAPGGNTPMAKGTKDVLGRCVEIVGIYHGLAKTYGFTTPDAEVCGLGSAENPNQPIPLGATRGEPTRESSKGAAGSFQVVPGTAGPIWASIRKDPNQPYNPQNIDHNMAVAIAHLETLKKKYGEDRFRAYNGGTKVKNGLPRYDWPEVRETTKGYDRYVRSHIPTFQAVLEGKVDFQSAEPAAMAASMSPPIPFDTGYISGIFGEPRKYRGKNAKHMGMDMAAIVGTDVLAITDGLVAFAGEHTNTEAGKRAGIQIQLTHGDGAIGKLGGSRYFHLATRLVNTGDRVHTGQKIGTIGLTGVHFSGAHLHFESYTWGTGRTLVVCQYPGAWFPTGQFCSNNPRYYTGPKTPGAEAAAKKFNRMNEEYLRNNPRG